jgi:drug/metabolite transporter (DMT)-like permease
MIAFAANSILCRVALGAGEIDAAGFTVVRMISGAVALAMICALRGQLRMLRARPDCIAVLALFGYAAAFSFAYRDLTAGTGALMLFGAVQATMIGVGLFRGERPGVAEWMGLVIAIGGLGWLVSPGMSAPRPVGAALMIVAGVAWGVYSLHGRKSVAPLVSTAANFIWSVPLALVLGLLMRKEPHATGTGIGWAALSGALASGAGYALWYSVLPKLTATRAATVQLTVPVIAALGGVAFLSEALSMRLVSSSVLVLGGVALAIFGRRR